LVGKSLEKALYELLLDKIKKMKRHADATMLLRPKPSGESDADVYLRSIISASFKNLS